MINPKIQPVIDGLVQGGFKMSNPAPGLIEFELIGVKYIFNEDGVLKYTVNYQINQDCFVEYYYDGKQRLKTSWNGKTVSEPHQFVIT